MSLRRIVALLLFVAVAASSVEVVFGLESSLAETNAEAPLVLAGAQIDGSSGPASGADEECACLCACLCSGAQLAVAPADAPTPDTHEVADPFTEHDHRFPVVPSPRPPHRPPLA